MKGFLSRIVSLFRFLNFFHFFANVLWLCHSMQNSLSFTLCCLFPLFCLSLSLSFTLIQTSYRFHSPSSSGCPKSFCLPIMCLIFSADHQLSLLIRSTLIEVEALSFIVWEVKALMLIRPNAEMNSLLSAD